MNYINYIHILYVHENKLKKKIKMEFPDPGLKRVKSYTFNLEEIYKPLYATMRATIYFRKTYLPLA